ncbi:MAG: hypothetical protein FJX23_03350 [Alphaproteobacteria bacterium]|nr:hypothetical protein [Alphaproteobacteria bacterium]
MFILLLLLMFSVLGVVLLGLFSMIKGGAFNEKYGNKLMVARVALQALALLVLLLMAATKSNG